MKMKLLERNLWGDTDTWRGRKNNHKVEIETPFRETDENFGKYSFRIQKPYGSIVNSYKENLYFDSFNECYDFCLKWINENK
ncbi:hypothetical protein [Rossellomorea marisflavi]|uniref:hypothetical protein n=1 Tax=Rossellomorea marisflavi TaxID=189381 RepID=UPI00345D9978